MEYLPEKRRTQKTQVLKKDKKIGEFREYLADNEVVLSFVKCKWARSTQFIHDYALVLVALRSQSQYPEDPQAYMLDYFGNERSPLWETMEEMQEENQQI